MFIARLVSFKEFVRKNTPPKLWKYFINILVSIDQLVNTLFGGDPDETISSRCGKSIRKHNNKNKWTIAYWLNKFLDLFDKDHCLKYIEDDEGKHQVL